VIRIARLERFGATLEGPVGAARAPRVERGGWLVALEDGDGVRGLGEASPLEGTSPDSADAVGSTLEALGADLGRVCPDGEALGALTPRDVGDLVSRMAALATLPAARFAVETALADVVSRRRGVSLAEWLSEGGALRPIPRSVLLGALTRDDLHAVARRAWERGARVFKLKATGDDPDREARAILDLRRAGLGDVEVRLDLNGGLDPASARRALDAYARAGVAWVEEPTAGDGLFELGPCAVPWLADESLVSPAIARRILHESACAGLVVKPTLHGLFGARDLALASLGVGKVAVVTHTFDGPVALSAAASLALALPRRGLLAPGLDRHAALSAFPPLAVPSLPEAATGVLSVVPIPLAGLGVRWGEPT
jgi:L-alanine-DL-glutamate epimerase-like enolase superfamily enzyme